MNSPVKNWRETKKLHNFLNKEGKLLVWTEIFTAPTGFEYQAPYLVGIVEFQDGKRMPVQIVDCKKEDLKINLKVVTCLRRIRKPQANDVIDYGIKVKPANGNGK